MVEGSSVKDYDHVVAVYQPIRYQCRTLPKYPSFTCSNPTAAVNRGLLHQVSQRWAGDTGFTLKDWKPKTECSTGCRFAGMGNLIKVLTRDIDHNAAHFFLDFERLVLGVPGQNWSLVMPSPGVLPLSQRDSPEDAGDIVTSSRQAALHLRDHQLDALEVGVSSSPQGDSPKDGFMPDGTLWSSFPHCFNQPYLGCSFL
ncbi:hypothetical protein Q9966_014714 [Columba livia]|nr:hypothetical protein Q9966_014714 [Columba livia]